MDKNQKYIIAGVIALIVIVAAWQIFKKPSQNNDSQQNQNQTQNENSSKEADINPKDDTKISDLSPKTGSTWEGMLKTSDNAKKGNLMLVTKDHTVYLKTSRDFSSLVGKNVTVSYEGSLDNFVLGDIVAK